MSEESTTFHSNNLVPELLCSNFDNSLEFYTRILGFTIAQRHGNDSHAYLALQGSQLMIAQQDGSWEPAALEAPYGRGINLRILVNNVHEIHESVLANGYEPFLELHTKWYWGTDRMDEHTQFGVLDPDGYFLRFSQVNKHRPINQAGLA